MNLALAILFLWLALALFYISFHPLPSGFLTGKGGKPTDVFQFFQEDIAKQTSAYNPETL